ncbi:MAG: iron permease, partial [Mycobacterium sp.]|uniref:EfeM/EfeO family lipoprotein n=1 Tax=Mycobacterium sp. TaxID=1785 RepID=UPI002602F880
RMTVLQVLAWVGYLAVVIPAFLRSSRQTPAPAQTGHGNPEHEPQPSTFSRLIARRPLAVAAAVVVVPAVLAAAVIALLPGSSASQATRVTVTASSCAEDWSMARSGSQTFTVVNKSGKTGEVNLVDANNGVVAEIETLGPATSAPMSATLTAGTYKFTCLLAGKPGTSSPAKQVSGQSVPNAPAPVVRVTEDDLKPAMQAYQRYVDGLLATLADQVQRIRAHLGAGNPAAAQADWTSAMLTWNRVGAAYGSFKGYGDAIAGLPHGLPGGVNDPDFKGLRRLEFGLWHGQPATQLTPVADALSGEVAKLRAGLGDAMPESADQTKRPQEILEDMQRFQLMGYTDQGAGTEYAETSASVEATRAVLEQFAPLITTRAPKVLGETGSQLDTLDAALHGAQLGGRWVPSAQVPPEKRRAVDAALGQALEKLASVPLLIELPPRR